MARCEVRLNIDEWALCLAAVSALRSPCVRRQVGAVLVKDGRVVSMGYNGPPRGATHRTECPGPNQCVRIGLQSGSSANAVCCVHAEMNALLFANREDATGATLYCTDSPCLQCCYAIINAGVSRVVCLKPYADQSGLEVLKQSNIEVISGEIEPEVAATTISAADLTEK